MRAEEREKTKQKIVRELRQTPIVEYACSKTGVHRSTYYRWRRHDNAFARAADHALEGGRSLVNDMAESQLLRLIKESNLTAIIFWLKHNEPRYANKVIHEYDETCPVRSTEEQHYNVRSITREATSRRQGMESKDAARDAVETDERDWDEHENRAKRFPPK